MARRASRWRLLLVPLLTAAIVTALIRQLSGGQQMLAALGNVRAVPILVALTISLGSLLLSGYRWRLVIASMRYSVTYAAAMRAVLAVWPIATLTPSRSGDFLRALCIREHVPLAAGVGSTFAEKLIDVQSLCLLCCGGALLKRLRVIFAAGLALLLGGWSLVLLIRRYGHVLVATPLLRRYRDTIEELSLALRGLRAQPKYFAAVVATSLLAWIAAMAVIGVLLRMTHAQLPLFQVVSLWPLATLAAAAPITLMGIGTRDAAFVALVTLTTPTPPPTSALLLATLLYPLVTAWFFALVGLPFMVQMGLTLGGHRRGLVTDAK